MRRISAEVALEPAHDGYFRRAIVETPRVRAYWLSFAPGTTVPEHAHGTADEIFYVVGGAARIELRDEVRDVEPGDTLVLEPGEFHRIVVAGDEPFVLLAVVAPNADDTLPGRDRA